MASALFSAARTAGARGYELLAMAVRAEALAKSDRREQATEVAREVERVVATRDDLERAERVLLHVARAHRACGDHEASSATLRRAEEVVSLRLEQIRSEELRQSYEGSRVVRSIRSELG